MTLDTNYYKRCGAIELIDFMQQIDIDATHAIQAYIAKYPDSADTLSAATIRQPVPNQAMSDFSVQRELRKVD